MPVSVSRNLNFLKQVLDDHGLNPSETVMVGNDLTTDIAVAEAVGIDSILLNTFPYSRRELENSQSSQTE